MTARPPGRCDPGILPLSGLRVVVTRAAEQSGELSGRFVQLGAEVIELPAIEFQPPADYGPLDEAVARLSRYDWIIFTSANGVRFFLERAAVRGANLTSLRARICAIGPGTRRAAERAGLRVDLVPREYVAESLIEAFQSYDLAGRRILLPRAAAARDVAPLQLRRRSAEVDVVEAYRAVAPAELAVRGREVFSADRKPDWVTFTSTSTVVNLIEAVGAEALAGVRVASIGPVTSAAVRRFGLQVTAEARVFTTQGLIEAILRTL